MYSFSVMDIGENVKECTLSVNALTVIYLFSSICENTNLCFEL